MTPVSTRLAYELGRAQALDPGDLRVARALCSPDADIEVEDLDPDDWLRAPPASEGRLCVRVDGGVEVAYLGWDDDTRDLIADVKNDVFLDRCRTSVTFDEARAMVEQFDVSLRRRERTPFEVDGGGDDAE